MKFSFLNQGSKVDHSVNGQMLTFRPLSFAICLEMKEFLEPLASALAILMAPPNRDIKTVKQDTHGFTRDDNRLASAESFVAFEPLSLEMARYRDEQRTQAIRQLGEALTKKSTQITVSRIILNSLRGSIEGVDGRNPSPDDCAEFLQDVDLDSLGQLLEGVLQANKRLFGPLGGQAKDMLSRALKTAGQSFAQSDDDEPEQPEQRSAPTKVGAS